MSYSFLVVYYILVGFIDDGLWMEVLNISISEINKWFTPVEPSSFTLFSYYWSLEFTFYSNSTNFSLIYYMQETSSSYAVFKYSYI